MSEDEAENRLGMVQQRAMALLDGHLPFTASFMKDDKEWYRARFAGFSKEDAQAACAALKKMSLDCVVMSAELAPRLTAGSFAPSRTSLASLIRAAR